MIIKLIKKKRNLYHAVWNIITGHQSQYLDLKKCLLKPYSLDFQLVSFSAFYRNTSRMDDFSLADRNKREAKETPLDTTRCWGIPFSRCHDPTYFASSWSIFRLLGCWWRKPIRIESRRYNALCLLLTRRLMKVKPFNDIANVIEILINVQKQKKLLTNNISRLRVAKVHPLVSVVPFFWRQIYWIIFRLTKSYNSRFAFLFFWCYDSRSIFFVRMVGNLFDLPIINLIKLGGL